MDKMNGKQFGEFIDDRLLDEHPADSDWWSEREEVTYKLTDYVRDDPDEPPTPVKLEQDVGVPRWLSRSRNRGFNIFAKYYLFARQAEVAPRDAANWAAEIMQFELGLMDVEGDGDYRSAYQDFRERFKQMIRDGHGPKTAIDRARRTINHHYELEE